MAGPGAVTQDRWQTAQITMSGGIVLNSDELAQSKKNPGSLTIGQNFEAALTGGYRRLSGFNKYDSAAPSGTGAILGIAVASTNSSVVALRNAKAWDSTGSGWSQLDTTDSASSFLSAASVTAGGSSYAVNNILTVAGGTSTTVAKVIVTSIGGGGAITGVSISSVGRYTVLPTTPNSVTGGAGTSATIALTFTSLARSTPTKGRYARYNWGTEKIIFADDTNYPFTFDGTNYVTLDQAPKATCVREFGNYMFYGKGNILTFSSPNSENDFSAANGAGSINVGFPILNLYPWRNELYIFGAHRISKLSGTIFGGASSNAVLSAVTSQIGCIGPDSIQEISGDLLFLAPDGLRTVAGTARIDDVELGAITKTNNSAFSAFTSRYSTYNFSSGLIRGKNQYRIFASTTLSNSTTAEGWIVSIRDSQPSYYGNVNSWEFFTATNFIVSCMDSSYIANGTELVVHGGWDGYVYTQEFGSSFAGSAVPAILKFPTNGFDDPELRKTFYKINVYGIIEGSISITGYYVFDFGANTGAQPTPQTVASTPGGFANYDDIGTMYDASNTYDSNPNIAALANTIGSGKNMALVITSNDTNAPYTIRSIILDYQVNGRR